MRRSRIARFTSALAVVAVAGGCGAVTDGPATVAERFWTAVQERDRETVEALSIASEDAGINLDREDAGPTAVEVGQVRTEGDFAYVDTRLEMQRQLQTLEVRFETVLTRVDGDWLVDLDATSEELVAAVLGVSMQELGRALGEGMKEAMEGAAEGMGNAMREMAEGMGDAMREMADSLERRDGPDSNH